MALPAVVMAYKERDNAFKLIVYAFVGIAVIYFLWKIFKALKKLGKIDDAVKEAVNDVKQKINDVKQKIDEHITTSSEYYERIRKEKEEIPKKVEELAKKYNLSDEEKEKLKESMLREVETKEQIVFFHAYHGGAVDYKKTLEKEREKQKRILKKKVKPTYKTNKELAKIYGKRWQAIARYYKRRRPASPLPKSMRIKPILKPVPKYKRVPAVLPRKRMVIAL